jgi:hypothetical protein
LKRQCGGQSSRLSEPLVTASIEAINDFLPLAIDHIRFAPKPIDSEFLAKLDVDMIILGTAKFPQTGGQFFRFYPENF